MNTTSTQKYKKARVAEASARQLAFDAFITHSHHELDRRHRREVSALAVTIQRIYRDGEPLEPNTVFTIADQVRVDPTMIWSHALFVTKVIREMEKECVHFRHADRSINWDTVQIHAEAALAVIHTAQRKATQASREEIR